MDAYDAMLARRTIRDFEDRKLGKDTVERLIEAGLSAPTNDHLRKWEYVIVDEIEDRRRLIEGIVRPLTGAEAESRVRESGMTEPTQREMYLEAIPRQYSMIVEAGVLIIPCFHEPGDLLHPRDLSSLNGFASIWCSIENILIAAAAEGIFGVTRIPSAEELERARELLGIPGAYQAACFMALGYPRLGARRTVQRSVVLKERIHHGKW
jgi:nitroreductase